MAPPTLRQRNLKTAFLLRKRIKCFLDHAANATITSQFVFVIEYNSCRKISSLTWGDRSQNVFSLHLIAKLAFSCYSALKSVFRIVPFSWQIRGDGRPNRRRKNAFPGFSDAVSTGPNIDRVLFVEKDTKWKYSELDARAVVQSAHTPWLKDTKRIVI